MRGERLVESFERISGARPGQRLQVDIRGITPLERTIRIVARQLALAITAGSALVACGATAAAVHVARWVPITLGAVGGALALILLSTWPSGASSYQSGWSFAVSLPWWVSCVRPLPSGRALNRSPFVDVDEPPAVGRPVRPRPEEAKQRGGGCRRRSSARAGRRG